MQKKPNLKHLYLPLHLDLEPHLVSCSQFSASSELAVQKTPHSSLTFFHPQSPRLSDSGWHWVDHMQPAWYAACLVCWSRAALVGGITSYVLCCRANMSSLTLSTRRAVLDMSYSTLGQQTSPGSPGHHHSVWEDTNFVYWGWEKPLSKCPRFVKHSSRLYYVVIQYHNLWRHERIECLWSSVVQYSSAGHVHQFHLRL